MFDYSYEIEKFWDEKVRMNQNFKEKLFAHRKANRDRLISRLPQKIEGLSISDSSFCPQGSMAMRTIIQTKFSDDEYDIDDGLILKKEELIDNEGNYLGTETIRNIILETLKDDRFVKQPKLHTNCVRVYYAETDEEKHHVDFAIFRRFNTADGVVKELANKDDWVESNPTQINYWFDTEVILRNANDGRGTQLRKLIQLLKRFARSRQDWDLPNGLKLTMLAAECQDESNDRIDVAFRKLLCGIEQRLNNNMIIKNLAHPEQPEITKTSADPNVVNLLDKVSMAIDKLKDLDEIDCDREKARKIWDWIFKTDGFFESIESDDNGETGIASRTPSKVVDHQGGGRFG
jgi:hypothetical protein